MKNPNRRYGKPSEMAYYAIGWPSADLCRYLRRSERSVQDWMSGRRRVPWWVPEILRLCALEHELRMQQMGYGRLAPRLHAVDGKVRELRVIPPAELELELELEADVRRAPPDKAQSVA